MDHVTLEQYRQWETGNNTFTAEEISIIVKAFGCSSDYLIDGKSDGKVLMEKASENGISEQDLIELISLVGKIKKS